MRPSLDPRRVARHRLRNLLDSALRLGGMGLLLLLLGRVLFGPAGMWNLPFVLAGAARLLARNLRPRPRALASSFLSCSSRGRARGKLDADLGAVGLTGYSARSASTGSTEAARRAGT